MIGHASTSAEQLAARLAVIEGQLGRVQAQLAAQADEVQAANHKLQAAGANLVQAGLYPASFWQAQAVFRNTPGGAGLLAAVARQQAAEAAILQQRHTELTALHAEARTAQQDWQEIYGALRAAEGWRERRLRQRLANAGQQTEALARRLAAALAEATPLHEAFTAPLVRREEMQPPPDGRPIKGRLAVRFKRGKGAEAEGVVFTAPPGQPVFAPVAGKVLFAGEFRQFGGVIILQGARGQDEVLAGLDQVELRAGQRVRQGEEIGMLGARGRLYWEVRVNNRARDPLAFRR